MSRNKENVAFRSTTPGHSLIYNAGKNPASEDFFTDSLLDMSRIPTPSPSKNLDGSEHFVKPRRAVPKNSFLKAPFAPTTNLPRRPSPEAGSAQPQSLQIKPALSQAKRRSPTPSRKETPSPPRRRPLGDLTSPTSDSSPPKGLTDVYQRIADEEDLAAQEREVLDDEEDYTEDSLAAGVHLSSDRALLEKIRKSQPSSSAPNSRNRSPENRLVDANKENRRRDDDTVLSEASGLSFLKELTDQALAAKLTPHTIDRAKDRARLDRAIQKDSPIAFSRAYGRPKASPNLEITQRNSPVAFSRAYSKSPVGLTATNLDQKRILDAGQPQRGSSTGSVTTEESEPPPNVPRTWGTKGKAGKEWLHRINSRYSSPANGMNKSVPESSQIDWTAAAADVPLPSIEGSSTPRGLSPEVPTSESLHRQRSLDRIKEWELNDFTGQSLQVSNSPVVKVRTSVLDQIREKEIESLEKQAVTTNRLGEIRKKDSQELLRKSRSSSIKIDRGAEADAAEADVGETRDINCRAEDQGEMIPDTPIIIFKAENNTPHDERTNGHAKAGRRDSRSNLQRLARAMSESPRTGSSPEDWSLVGNDEGNIVTMPSEGEASPILHLDLSRKSSKQVMDADTTPQLSKAVDLGKTPVVTGAWTDTILPDTIKTAKRSNAPGKYMQTPHVNAGGWVDTHLPAGRRQSSALAPMTIDEVPEGLTDGIEVKPPDTAIPPTTETDDHRPSQPDLLSSALSTLLSKAKRKLSSTQPQPAPTSVTNDTLLLGDATIESLEDLLTLDAADMTTLMRMGAASAVDPTPASGPVSETELLARLGTKLDRLRSNITDARRGLSKLEHQVSHSPDPSTALSTRNPDSPCESCGCPGPAAGWRSATYVLTIPRLYTFPSSPSKHRLLYIPRPTLLGWALLLFLFWYIGESLMCAAYCHPAYADVYTWPTYPEPKGFGNALPVVLGRWSGLTRGGGGGGLGAAGLLTRACVRGVWRLCGGGGDGFVDVPVVGAGGGGGGGVAGIDLGMGEAGSMMNDDYL